MVEREWRHNARAIRDVTAEGYAEGLASQGKADEAITRNVEETVTRDAGETVTGNDIHPQEAVNSNQCDWLIFVRDCIRAKEIDIESIETEEVRRAFERLKNDLAPQSRIKEYVRSCIKATRMDEAINGAYAE